MQELSQRVRGRSLPQPSSSLVLWHPLHLFPPAGNNVVLLVKQFLRQIVVSVVLRRDKPLATVSLKKHVQTAMPGGGVGGEGREREGECVHAYKHVFDLICVCGRGGGKNGRGQ